MLVRTHQRHNPTLQFCFAAVVTLGFGLDGIAAETDVRSTDLQFAREIRPVLARNCFACHGPDAETREADLRLDERDAAIDAGAIDIDQLDQSELLARIVSADPDEQMPPPDSGKRLTPKEIELLRRWVESGAEYEQHWAFEPPQKPAVPKASEWAKNEIDHFIERRVNNAGLRVSLEANRDVLLRRLYTDLIGLVPTPGEADEFMATESNDDSSYDYVVDRLLKSKHYGERWARSWLDLARYSDTNGYEKDRPRSIWPYRDWVIEALNSDMPFDQFTIEQLAGDMLQNASLRQRIATGFHRNTMLNEEGGIDPLEYRFYAMVDRVATTGTVWMGLTVGCAQCHTHKYDPISHTDYYRFMALLNNADEPDLSVDADKTDASLHSEIADLESKLRSQFPAAKDFDKTFAAWHAVQRRQRADWVIAPPTEYKSNLPKLERLKDDSLFASGDFTKRDEYQIRLRNPTEHRTEQPITAIRLEALPDERLPAGGPGRAYYEGRKGDFFLSELKIKTESGEPLAFTSSSQSYGKIAVGSGDAEAKNVYDNEGSTGWSTANREGERHTLVLNLAEPTSAETLDVTMLFERHFVAALGRFRFSVTTSENNPKASSFAPEVESILAKPLEDLSDGERERIELAFLRRCDELAEARKPIEKLKSKLRSKTMTMVMQERAVDNLRVTQRHHRGEWLTPREKVTGGVPSIFPQLPGNANRLALAKWLVSDQNPLVARVVVNRAWRQLMGYGLVRSDGDFGTQSEPPTHPELLDWLATEFMERGWSMKWLHRKIVSSATYRQRSDVTPSDLAADPLNRYFARASRTRADAETIRDIILCASGMMSEKIGGPSVRPPQPSSVTSVAYGGTKWNASTDDDRYRRSLYTYNKRTAPFAAYTTFDGPTGENCIAKRSRSNTPLQALTLLNDEMYLEFAQGLGERASKRAGDRRTLIGWMFRRLLTRRPTDEELTRLVGYHVKQKARLESGELVAKDFATDQGVESAALVLVARVLMNLDEVITKH